MRACLCADLFNPSFLRHLIHDRPPRTSGARVSLVQRRDDGFNEVFSDAIRWDGDYDDPAAWTDAVFSLTRKATEHLGGDASRKIKSLCVSGTSASCLIVDGNGEPTRKPRMYNYDVLSSGDDRESAQKALDLLDQHAPPRHTARANTGSLAKLVTWAIEKELLDGEALCHQADYVTMKLLQTSGDPRPPIRSDWHNCLKCGYDVRNLQWPEWLHNCLESAGVKNVADVVPESVVSPGAQLGSIAPEVAKELGLSEDVVVVGGTTDSNAAFFAAVGGTRSNPGTAVTSLGSTLAMKQLSSTFVEDASRGVYSHRFPCEDGSSEAWLIGGASNVGCAVLRSEGFSNEELVELSNAIDPSVDSPLSYYPLVKKGERFPVADSEKKPCLEPVPSSRAEYLHGILQGITGVERDGFVVLGELGASPSQPSLVWTCGGGSQNEVWTKMRQRKLRERFETDEIVVEKASNTEASFGAAILAASSL